jgi:hypothetical protein
MESTLSVASPVATICGSSVSASAGSASTSDRPSAHSRGDAQDAFERVVPQRDLAVALNDRHAFVQRFDHFMCRCESASRPANARYAL